ncbi:ABC transporter permease [Brucella pseudogrignonensis]|uniref:ABC transporter permease n=1 Tax=Brucella pseudogrignonensis TaxID=419475 RepID=UPI001E31A54E|nr:ABC transporter permease [Brucella pseudogrignonensis]MCD4511764.1 ABC transporter permease [Brucella pseudogrignonensis]
MSVQTPATTRILSSRFGHVGHSLELRMFLLTAFIVIGLSFASPYFLTYNNILNVLDQSVVVGILAVGLTLVILTAGIDLSVGSTVGLTGVAMAVSFPVLGFYPGIAIGLLTGAVVGFANGFIIEKGGVAAFIVTLGMMSICRSLTYTVSGARSITDLPPQLSEIATGMIGGIPINVIFLIFLYAFVYWLLKKTKMGRSLYAVGSNPEAARVAGLPVGRYKISVYVITGVLCALAAVFLAGRIRSVDPTSGLGLELDAIAATVIGGTSLFGGRGSIIGTFFGVIIMVCIRNGLNLLGIDPYWQGTVIGTIIIAAVLLERLLNANR